MIGIIIATNLEAPHLFDRFHVVQTKRLFNRDFYFIKIQEQTIIITFSGYGKVNAAFSASLLIDHFQCNKIINIGTCGAMNNSFKQYDVCIPSEVMYGDVDATSFGYDYGQIPKEPLSYHYSVSSLIDNLKKTLKKYRFFEGLLLTTESFINSSNYQNILRKLASQCDVVDMEASALAQVCYQTKKDLIIIKIVSDNILTAKNNAHDWKLSLQKINDMVIDILSQIIAF